MASRPSTRMTSATGVKTAKKITPITIGLTIMLSSSPNFIHACFRGASHCARVSVMAARSAATASAQGCEIAPMSRKITVKVQPNLRSDGIMAVVVIGASKIARRRPHCRPSVGENARSGRTSHGRGKGGRQPARQRRLKRRGDDAVVLAVRMRIDGVQHQRAAAHAGLAQRLEQVDAVERLGFANRLDALEEPALRL